MRVKGKVHRAWTLLTLQLSLQISTQAPKRDSVQLVYVRNVGILFCVMSFYFIFLKTLQGTNKSEHAMT